MIILEKIRAIKRNYSKAKKRRKIERSPVVTKEMILKDLKEFGIHKGDVIFLHSSLSSIGKVEGGANTVIHALIEAVSLSGTIIIPTFHMVERNMYATCMAKDYVFDPKTAGTYLGAIPSTFLKMPGVERSIHPTHSVSAYGKYAKYIVENHQNAISTYGVGSPWERFLNIDGKVMGIGVSMAPTTFYHMVEDLMLDAFPLPVRMKENFSLKCKDHNGNLIDVIVTPLDPKYASRRIDHRDREDLREYFWNEFHNNGMLKIGKIGMSTSWYISAKAFYNHLVTMATNGITIYTESREFNK